MMAEHASRDEVTTNLDLSHGFLRCYKMRPTQFRRKERMESGGAKRREILRGRERERFGTGRKEKSSLPRSIEAGEKGVREARHVLAGVKSIPAKERKTREKRGALVSRSVIISILGRSFDQRRKRNPRYEKIGTRRVVNHSFVRREMRLVASMVNRFSSIISSFLYIRIIRREKFDNFAPV